MNRECQKEEKNSKLKWSVLFLLLIIIILTISIGIVFLIIKIRSVNTTKIIVSNENISGGVGLVINPDAENSISNENNTAEQGVAISGWGTMVIPAGEEEITVDLYNPKENDGLYYLTFELRLYNTSEQDYEVLYTSGLVEPGKHINKITLSHGLEKGEYEAVVHVQPYRMNKEKTITNNADMNIVIIVK